MKSKSSEKIRKVRYDSGKNRKNQDDAIIMRNGEIRVILRKVRNREKSDS